MVDSDGAASDPFIVMIVVKPMNTLAPVVTTNTGLQLFEGQSRPLRADRNLFVSDEDNLDDVKVRWTLLAVFVMVAFMAVSFLHLTVLLQRVFDVLTSCRCSTCNSS